MTFVGCAERYNNGFWFAKVQGSFPSLQRNPDLPLQHHILQRLKTAFQIPDFKEQSIDHDTGRECTITSRFALEKFVMSLSYRYSRGSHVAVPPGVLICNLHVPQRFRGRKLQ